MFERLKGWLGSKLMAATFRDPPDWLYEAFAGYRSSSGVSVNPNSAQSLAVYYACISAISQDLAKLPKRIVFDNGDGTADTSPDHPYWDMLSIAPNPAMTGFSFYEIMTAIVLGWGNAVAQIVRTSRRQAKWLIPIMPQRLTIRQDQNTGLLTYEVRGYDGKRVSTLGQDDVVHVPGLGDGIIGQSVCSVLRESLGVGMAAQQYAGAFFKNGAAIGGVLEYPGTLKPQMLEELRENWTKQYAGSTKAGSTPILQGGMKFVRVGIPPDEAQFLETRKFQAEEVCRPFRIPLHKVQILEHATFTNIEHQAKEYVDDTLTPWMRKFEQEIDRKLLAGTKFRFVFSADQLLRGDQLARSEYLRRMWTMGGMSRNEVRASEGLNPVDGGDDYWAPANMAPIGTVRTNQLAQAKGVAAMTVG